MRRGGVIVREKSLDSIEHRDFEKGKNKRSARSDGLRIMNAPADSLRPEAKQSGSQRMGVLIFEFDLACISTH